MAKTKTTRNTKFNSYKDTETKTMDTVTNATANATYTNIRLLDSTDGVRVSGKLIIDDAKANKTLKELGYDVTITDEDLEGIDTDATYYVFGAPHKQILNNRQHYNNCGVESTLNNLAMAGIYKMKSDLSDQKTFETDFLKKVWTLGLVEDEGVIGVLDEPDGGTTPADYKEMFKYFDIGSKAYYTKGNTDGVQYSDIDDLGIKISEGYGAVLGVCAEIFWKDEIKDPTSLKINHAIAITGAVYDGADPSTANLKGFYVHDSGAWMTRFVTVDKLKEATLWSYQGVDSSAANYLSSLRDYNYKTEEYVGKAANGLFITITDAPIKNDTFNLNATGDKNANVLYGNSLENAIKGMEGNDTLYGASGDDEVYGGKGHDVIFGNGKIDTDITRFKKIITKESVIARVDNSGYVKNSATDAAFEGINLIKGEDGHDIIFGGSSTDLIYGGNGNDTVITGEGRNAAYGGNGNDVIIGGDDNDRLFGGAGNDVIYGFEDEDIISAADGNDTVYGGRGDDIISVGKGNDIVYIEGKEHGMDKIKTDAGSLKIAFINDVNDTNPTRKLGYSIDEMYFAIDKEENVKNSFEFDVAYTNDEDNIKDGVAVSECYNSKTNITKNLTIVDVDNEKYKVKITNEAKAQVASVSTKNNTNNILFATSLKNMTVTTSTKDDIVYMTDSMSEANIKDLSRKDKITYTGGKDQYHSLAGDTKYYLNSFDEDAHLKIYDNIKLLDKVKINIETFESEKYKANASENDALYVNSKLSNLKFIFDVENTGETRVFSENDGLFIFDNESFSKEKLAKIASDDDSISGFTYMDSFFKAGEAYNSENKYGNGRIESLYTKENGQNYIQYETFNTNIAEIASNVAGWLNSHTTYASAFDAFKSDTISESDLNALIACYATDVPA